MFVKNVISFGLANTYVRFVRIAQEFIIRIILPPEILGIWSLAMVVMNFGITFDLGVISAVAREFPLLYGAGKKQLAVESRYAAFWLHFFSKIIVALGIVIYVICNIHRYSSMIIIADLAVAPMIVIASISESFAMFYQVTQQFVSLSKLLVLYWTLYCILLVIGAYVAGVSGLLIASLLAYILQAIILKRGMFDDDHRIYKPAWSWYAVKSLLWFALPFRLVDYPMSLLTMADSLFVARFFGLKMLAIYATSKLILNQAGEIPSWICSVFLVKLNTHFGRNEQSRKELKKEALLHLSIQYLIIVPLLICLVVIMTCFVVVNFLPKYLESLSFLPVLLLTLYFLPRVTVFRNFWLVEKRFKSIGISNLIGLGVMILGLGLLEVYNRLTLLHVAYVYLLSYAFYFLYMILTLGRELWDIKQICLLMWHLCLSIGFVLIVFKIGGFFSNEWMYLSFIALVVLACKIILVIIPLIAYGLWYAGAFKHGSRLNSWWGSA